MLREICDRHGVLLIADEVINGFGRTGTMFAIEPYGIVPDIMTIAKGLSSGYAPAAAAIMRTSIFDEVYKEHSKVPFGHLLTFGGHPVCAAAALKNLEIFEQEDLVARGAEMGEYLMARLEELRAHRSVGDVRGRGLLTAIEFVKNKETKTPFTKDSLFTKRVNELILERGFISRVWSVLHFAPPLVVTTDEIDTMVTIADEALTIAERELTGEFDA